MKESSFYNYTNNFHVKFHLIMCFAFLIKLQRISEINLDSLDINWYERLSVIDVEV